MPGYRSDAASVYSQLVIKRLYVCRLIMWLDSNKDLVCKSCTEVSGLISRL